MAAVPRSVRRRSGSIVLLLAIAFVAISSVTSVDLVGPVVGLPTTILDAAGAFGIIGVLVVLTAIVIVASTLEEFDMVGSSAVALANVIRAAAVVIGLGIVVQNVQRFLNEALQWWWVPPLLAVGYALFVFFQKSSETAKATTALRRTRRALGQDVERSVEFAVGSVVLVIALGLSALSGALQAAGGLGDRLLTFAGEAAFLAVSFLGCGSLGGCGLGFVQDLSPRMWLSIAFAIGAVALFIREDK